MPCLFNSSTCKRNNIDIFETPKHLGFDNQVMKYFAIACAGDIQHRE